MLKQHLREAEEALSRRRQESQALTHQLAATRKQLAQLRRRHAELEADIALALASLGLSAKLNSGAAFVVTVPLALLLFGSAQPPLLWLARLCQNL